jgi:hypothetical protein
MDAIRFDRFTRALAAASSRRAAVRLLVAAPAVALATMDAAPSAARKRRGRGAAGPASEAASAACNLSCRTCSPSLLKAGANLSGCALSGADLAERNLRSANLSRVCFQGANLNGARLDGGNLSGACLTDADLRQANLRGVNLQNATLCGADLAGADLRGAQVSDAQLACAFVCDTRLPNGKTSNRDLGTDRACVSCDKGCPEGEHCCGGACFDLLTNVKHCLTCGNTCPAAPQHATVECGEAPGPDGRLTRGCIYRCDTGWDDCDNRFATGCEVFTEGDPNNCGVCGHKCPEGLECCGCDCVEPGSGTCGVCSTIRSAKLIRP